MNTRKRWCNVVGWQKIKNFKPRAALSLYGASNKEELIGSLEVIFSNESYDSFKEEILSLIEGNTKYSIEVINKRLPEN
jgi:hypothetical protein